jgi:predicted transglutaminase-like cysteine proteinase
MFAEVKGQIVLMHNQVFLIARSDGFDARQRASVQMNGCDIIVAVMDKWQTLITGCLALGAAFVALLPVYKQLALMRAQNNVMVRSTIGEMILKLDSHRNHVHEIVAKRLTDMNSALHYFDNQGMLNDGGGWAGDQHRDFSNAQSALKALFNTSHDVTAIEKQKTKLLSAVNQLINTLWVIYAPEDADRFPEEDNWSEEEIASANALSNEAVGEVEPNTRAVFAAMHELNEAYEAEKATLVRRLRIIDDQLLAQP